MREQARVYNVSGPGKNPRCIDVLRHYLWISTKWYELGSFPAVVACAPKLRSIGDALEGECVHAWNKHRSRVLAALIALIHEMLAVGGG